MSSYSFVYKMDRNNYPSKIAESKIKDITNSINIQFARQCPHYQTFLHKVADDIIARYSSKQQPHPHFFKQDSTTAINQFTLFSDRMPFEYCQVLRKFDFLSTPANILGNLTASSLRLCDFFAKKLHQYMKISEPVSTATQEVKSFCSSCGKLKQNQKIRVLKDELRMDCFNQGTEKIRRDVITRTGQKYDVEELLQQQLQTLDMLNEDEIRKKLINLQLDHDRRKQEMLICIEELKRANERVAGYRRVLQKKKDFGDGNFDIKEYVFQLGRHFCHNLSNIDHRIKMLKQNIIPMIEVASQTESEEHLSEIGQQQEEVGLKTDALKQSKQQLIIEQRRNTELQKNYSMLDEKLRKMTLKRQEQQIQTTMKMSNMKGKISLYENKINSLQTIIKKIKSNIPIKEFTNQELSFCGMVKTSTTGVQYQQQEDVSKYVQDSICVENRKRSNMRTKMGKSKEEAKTSFTIHPRFLRHLSNLSNISNEQSQFMDPSFHQIINQAYKMHKNKLEVQNVINDTILPCGLLPGNHLKPPNSRQSIESEYSKTRASVQYFDNEQPKKKALKPSKMGIYKKRLDKLGILRNRQSVLALGCQDQTRYGSVGRDSYTDLVSMESSTRKTSKKNIKTIHQANFHEKNYIDKEYQQKFNNSNTLQKKSQKIKRYFSQEISFDHEKQNKHSLQQQLKDKNIFTEISQLINIRHSQSDTFKKNGKLSIPQKSDFGKIVLNLEEISYCTYFYSLMANLKLKDIHLYKNVKTHVCKLSAQIQDDQGGVKESLKHLLVAHRKCKKMGTVCEHLDNLLQIVKQM